MEIYGFLLAAQSTGVLIGALLSSKLEQFRECLLSPYTV
ncbi:hypothetical protein B4065_0628 [Caldibacillus thermoamylovorans]|nr:hypothetical protein B4065_0628 [Caldibacillus thermoamylovorans]